MGNRIPIAEAAARLVAERAEGRATPSPSSATNAHMVCPHCNTKGQIVTRSTKLKQGISGAKATGALLTVGFSVLATGLSRKQKVTECNCLNCGMKWHVA